VSCTAHTTVQSHTPGDKNPQLYRGENLKTEQLKYFNVLCTSVFLNWDVHYNMDVTVILDEHHSLICNWVLYTQPFCQLALFPSSAVYHFPDGCSKYWKMFTIMVLVLYVVNQPLPQTSGESLGEPFNYALFASHWFRQ